MLMPPGLLRLLPRLLLRLLLRLLWLLPGIGALLAAGHEVLP